MLGDGFIRYLDVIETLSDMLRKREKRAKKNERRQHVGKEEDEDEEVDSGEQEKEAALRSEYRELQSRLIQDGYEGFGLGIGWCKPESGRGVVSVAVGGCGIRTADYTMALMSERREGLEKEDGMPFWRESESGDQRLSPHFHTSPFLTLSAT